MIYVFHQLTCLGAPLVYVLMKCYIPVSILRDLNVKDATKTRGSASYLENISSILTKIKYLRVESSTNGMHLTFQLSSSHFSAVTFINKP